MSRPLRLEFAGALYHVTLRGDRREPIFEDDADRVAWLQVLAEALDRFQAPGYAYCLMDNHYHIVLQTHRPNLSRLMRHVNGVYTRRYNRRHGKVGHLFQGRFKAVLVDEESYFLEVCRYVDLNPVRALGRGAVIRRIPQRLNRRPGSTARRCTGGSPPAHGAAMARQNMPSSWRKAKASSCGTGPCRGKSIWAMTPL